MAFGNQGETRRRRRPVSEATEADAVEEPTPEEEEAKQEFQGRLVVLLSMMAIFGGLIFTGPHTYSTSAKAYQPKQLVSSAMTFEIQNDSKILSMENKYNLDFSRILTPAREETSPAMQRVAVACLPNPPKRPLVLPHKAHRYYSQAKNYLKCAMTKDVQRLCDPDERKRLVEQLTQFRERRAAILSLKEAKDRINTDKLKGRRLRVTEEVVSARWNMPPGETQLDPSLGARLSGLVQQGYLSAKDFGYFGLYLPAEYAPYLDQPGSYAPRCG